jgi:hypothetical protein
MTVHSRRRGLRVAAHAARYAWGLAILAAPGRMLAIAGGPNDRRGRATLRVLGARHLLQAALTGSHPRSRAARIAAAVDAAHALTAVGLAAVDRRRRTIATFDALIAASWAWLDVGR